LSRDYFEKKFASGGFSRLRSALSGLAAQSGTLFCCPPHYVTIPSSQLKLKSAGSHKSWEAQHQEAGIIAVVVLSSHNILQYINANSLPVSSSQS
jgi:hypothetical protein